MFDCGLHHFCTALIGPPVQLGRYRVTAKPDGGWAFSSAPVSLRSGAA
jgi:hypothetical protein